MKQASLVLIIIFISSILCSSVAAITFQGKQVGNVEVQHSSGPEPKDSDADLSIVTFEATSTYDIEIHASPGEEFMMQSLPNAIINAPTHGFKIQRNGNNVPVVLLTPTQTNPGNCAYTMPALNGTIENLVGLVINAIETGNKSSKVGGCTSTATVPTSEKQQIHGFNYDFIAEAKQPAISWLIPSFNLELAISLELAGKLSKLVAGLELTGGIEGGVSFSVNLPTGSETVFGSGSRQNYSVSCRPDWKTPTKDKPYCHKEPCPENATRKNGRCVCNTPLKGEFENGKLKRCVERTSPSRASHLIPLNDYSGEDFDLGGIGSICAALAISCVPQGYVYTAAIRGEGTWTMKTKVKGVGASSEIERKFCLVYDLETSHIQNWHMCPDDPIGVMPNWYQLFPRLDLRQVLPACQFYPNDPICDALYFGTIPFTSPPGDERPDLRVSSIRLQGSYDANAPITGTFSISNDGRSFAPNTVVNVRLSGPNGFNRAPDYFTGALQPSESSDIHFSSADIGFDLPNAPAGNYTLLADANPENDFDEVTRINNQNQVSLTVNPTAQGGDVRLVSVIPSPLNVSADSTLHTVNMVLTNVGNGYFPSSELKLQINTPSQSVVIFQGVGGIATGMSRTVEVSVPINGVGDYSLQAIADHDNRYEEVSELNNTAYGSFVAYGNDQQCLPCTTGAPDNFVGAQMCYLEDELHRGSKFMCKGKRADGSSCSNSTNAPNGWENVGYACPPPEEMQQGWNPDMCGTPNRCYKP